MTTRWSDLVSDPGMVAALDTANAAVPRDSANRMSGVSREELRKLRHRWSNAFADGCAAMIAAEVRRHDEFRRLQVLPSARGPAEPRTFVAGDKKKKVDVVVSSAVSGLQVGISLKAMNFRDAESWQFDKNLTGRTYELQDELRVIHEYQPAAFMVAVYFLPLGATVDKRLTTTASSFARTVEHLRARTGRLDRFLTSQLSRADLSAVALYVPGDRETIDDEVLYEDPFPRGVVRYFDVSVDPPWRGRPRLETTLSLTELVARIAEQYCAGEGEPIRWAEPEVE